jgi:hypothetical protein
MRVLLWNEPEGIPSSALPARERYSSWQNDVGDVPRKCSPQGVQTVTFWTKRFGVVLKCHRPHRTGYMCGGARK